MKRPGKIVKTGLLLLQNVPSQVFERVLNIPLDSDIILHELNMKMNDLTQTALVCSKLIVETRALFWCLYC